MIQVKKSCVVLSVLLLSACSVVPEQAAKPAPVQEIKEVEVVPELVPDEVVQMLTASGTPQEARKLVLHYIENGATCPILYPLGDVKAMIDTFSDWDGVS